VGSITGSHITEEIKGTRKQGGGQTRNAAKKRGIACSKKDGLGTFQKKGEPGEKKKNRKGKKAVRGKPPPRKKKREAFHCHLQKTKAVYSHNGEKRGRYERKEKKKLVKKIVEKKKGGSPQRTNTKVKR